MRFDINLASRPYEDVRLFNRRWGRGLAGLTLVTVAFCVWSVRNWNSVAGINENISRLQADNAALDNQRAENEKILKDPANQDVRARSEFLNGVILRRSFSWTRAFADLEQTLPAGVKVVKIEPTLRPDRQLEIKMTVASASHEKLLDFVRKLETSSSFRQATILKESAVQGQDPDAAVNLDLTALYIPGTATAKPRAETKGGGA